MLNLLFLVNLNMNVNVSGIATGDEDVPGPVLWQGVLMLVVDSMLVPGPANKMCQCVHLRVRVKAYACVRAYHNYVVYTPTM